MTIEFLDPTRCALMIVDIQDRLMRVINGRDQVVANSVLLLKTAQTLKMPIIATTQYVARIGELLPEITAELGTIQPMDKMEFSCFNNSQISSSVQELDNKADTLIICGVEAHICIYQTALGARRDGYNVWVPSDAVSSRTPENHSNALDRINEIGCTIASTEMIIYELLQKAGTPEFKELLPFLK